MSSPVMCLGDFSPDAPDKNFPLAKLTVALKGIIKGHHKNHIAAFRTMKFLFMIIILAPFSAFDSKRHTSPKRLSVYDNFSLSFFGLDNET